MNSPKPHRLDLSLHPRRHLNHDDICIYFLEKEAEGYSKSEANNLVHNFKKPVDRRGLPEWKYKEQAIQKFTRMLCQLRYGDNTVVVPAPTSKPRGHKEWDDRIDRAVDGLSACSGSVVIEKILDTSAAHTPAHNGGSRLLSDIRETSICTPIIHSSAKITIIVDDVLATGAHFKVWKQMIIETNPQIESVVGIFLSLHLWDTVTVLPIEL